MKRTIILLAGLALGLTGTSALGGGDPEMGKQKSAVCAGCHGADGNSAIPTNPRLAGQHASYLVQALRDYKSGARKNPIMAGFAAALSEQDIADLAAWFASQDGLVTPTD